MNACNNKLIALSQGLALALALAGPAYASDRAAITVQEKGLLKILNNASGEHSNAHGGNAFCEARLNDAPRSKPLRAERVESAFASMLAHELVQDSVDSLAAATKTHVSKRRVDGAGRHLESDASWNLRVAGTTNLNILNQDCRKLDLPTAVAQEKLRDVAK